MNITKGKISKAQKVVIYGPEGIGKSTLAAQFPDPLFIDTEGSTCHLDVKRTDAPRSWTELLEMVKEVKATKGLCQTLIIDTADWAESLCINQILAVHKKQGIEDFGYGKGYVYVQEAFGGLLNLLSDVVEVGINVVLTAHAKMRKFEQPDEIGAYDRWEMKLSKQVAPIVKEWADMVLFCNYKTLSVAVDKEGKHHKAQGGKRVMYTSHHACWDAKNRHGLPDELPLDYNAISHCFNANPTAANVTAQQPAPVSAAATTNIAAPTPANPRNQEHATATAAKTAPVASPAAESDIPPEIASLMQRDDIAEVEIREVFAKKGYYPQNTPWKAMIDSGFVSGWIVPQWTKIVDMVRSNPNRIPF